MAGIAAILEIAFVRIVVSMTRNAVDRFIRESLGGVAALAFLLFVNAVQRESSQVVSEKYRILPVHFRVAALTLGAQHSFVRILIQMTRVAARQQLHGEDRLDVAVVARKSLMPAEEFVIGLHVVIKGRFCPLGADMAGVTLLTAMLVMRIIFEMTGHAGHIHLVFKRILRVAVAASRLSVLAFQRKFRVAHMVEAGVMPVGGVMAILTLFPAATLMGIILGVTTETSGRGVEERPVLVAVSARRFLVLADQRKVRRIVIEFRIGPFGGLVAGSAVVTHRLFMG